MKIKHIAFAFTLAALACGCNEDNFLDIFKIVQKSLNHNHAYQPIKHQIKTFFFNFKKL